MSFNDTLKAAMGRLGHTIDDPDRDADVVKQQFNFGFKPKKTCSIDVERKDVVSGASVTEKSKIVVKLDHGDCKTDWTLANDKTAIGAMGTLVNDNDYTVKLGGTFENKAAKDEWKVVGKLEAAAADVGGAKVSLTADIEHKNDGSNMCKPSLMINANNEFYLGAVAKFSDKSMKECWPQVYYNPADLPKSMFWLRGDTTRGHAAAGFDWQMACGAWHTWEAIYGWRGLEGIKGQPIKVRGGCEYELSDETTISASVEVDKNYGYGAEVEHKFNKNWTGKIFNDFNSANCAKDSTGSSYHIGFGMAYKL
jgi:hypothetical protein